MHEGKIRRVKRILYPLVKIIAYAGSSAEGYPTEIKIFFFLFLIDKSEFIEVFRMKQKVPMICNIVSLILLIVFVIKSIVDYTQYLTSLNSAPFYLWVLVNALFLIIPAIILFVIGFVVKKKQ